MSHLTVPGVPDYGPGALALLGRVEDAILRVLTDAGYVRVAPPILELAEPFVETSGEDIRRRLYSFTDPTGVEYCLRPELTIPTCRLHLRDPGRGAGPARLAASGPAFRHQDPARGRPRQFQQVDAELLDAADAPEADAEIVALAVACARAGGLGDARLTLGDLGLLFDLLNRLDVAPRWQAKLRRALGRAGAVETLLSGFAGAADPGRADALVGALGTLGPARARAVVEEILALAQIPPIGGRSVEEIADRFLARAADASASALDAAAVGALRDFFAINGAPDAVLADLAARFGGLGLDLDPLRRRFDALARRGVDMGRVTFSGRFTRPIDYYTGHVFEMTVAGREARGPVVAGGRYDGLMARLGAGRDIPAVGFALWSERLIDQAGLSPETAP